MIIRNKTIASYFKCKFQFQSVGETASVQTVFTYSKWAMESREPFIKSVQSQK